MAFGWEGEKVRLVPLDRKRHLENAVKWFNDPEVTRWTAMGDWPLTDCAEEKFFELADGDQRQSLHLAVENIEGSVLDELVVTNSIPLDERAAACARIRQLSVAELVAESIRRVNAEESVGTLFMD